MGRKHSPFTAALLKHIATPNVEIRLVLGRVRDEVVSATNPVQTPHIYGTLGGKEFYLQPQLGPPAVSAPVTTPPPTPELSEAERVWAAVKDSTSIAQLEIITTRFKGTVYADLAQARIDELKKQEESKKIALASPTAAQAPKKIEEICVKLRGSTQDRVQRKVVNRGKIGPIVVTKTFPNVQSNDAISWCIVEHGVWYREAAKAQGDVPLNWLLPLSPANS